MTPPDDDRPDGPDLYDETPPRSIFSATWVRIVLVLIVVGVVGAVTVPYILDAMNPPTKTVSRAMPTTPPPAITPPAPAPPPSVAPAPPVAVPPAAMDKPAAAPDKPAAVADKPAAVSPVKPAPAEKPADKPAATAKPAPVEKPEKPAEKMVAATTEKPKPAAKPPAAAKSDEAPATRRAAARSSTASTPPATSSGPGGWWVQVGAFRDQDTASKLVAKLREDKYNVEESPRAGAASKPAAADKPAASAPAGSDLYDVFVTGLSASELNARLASKGLAAEASPSGAVIKPSLPLRDAVALSKDLAVEGLKVQVRRASSGAPAAAAKPVETTVAAGGGETLYRVRVGAFPDRATAVSTLKELEAKGYKPFIARGQ